MESLAAYLGVGLAALGAFIGALFGVGRLGWQLSRQFSNVYRKMDAHEMEDVKRFADLKAQIADAKMQAQTLEAFKFK